MNEWESVITTVDPEQKPETSDGEITFQAEAMSHLNNRTSVGKYSHRIVVPASSVFFLVLLCGKAGLPVARRHLWPLGNVSLISYRQND